MLPPAAAEAQTGQMVVGKKRRRAAGGGQEAGGQQQAAGGQQQAGAGRHAGSQPPDCQPLSQRSNLESAAPPPVYVSAAKPASAPCDPPRPQHATPPRAARVSCQPDTPGMLPAGWRAVLRAARHVRLENNSNNKALPTGSRTGV